MLLFVFLFTCISGYNFEVEIEGKLLDNLTTVLDDLVTTTTETRSELSDVMYTLVQDVWPGIVVVEKGLSLINHTVITQESLISNITGTVSDLSNMLSNQASDLNNIVQSVGALNYSVSEGFIRIKECLHNTSSDLKQQYETLQAKTVSSVTTLLQDTSDSIVNSVRYEISEISSKLQTLENKVDKDHKLTISKADEILRIMTTTVEIGECKSNLTLAMMMTSKENMYMKYIHQECKLPARCHGYTKLYPSHLLSNDWYWVQPLSTSIPYKVWCEFGYSGGELVGWTRMIVKSQSDKCSKNNVYRWSEEEIEALNITDIAVTEEDKGLLNVGKPSWLLRNISVEEMSSVFSTGVKKEFNVSVVPGADVIFVTCKMLKCSARGDEYIRFYENYTSTHQIVLNLRCNQDQVEMYGENSRGWKIFSQTYNNIDLSEGAEISIKITRQSTKLNLLININTHDFTYNGNWQEFSQYKFEHIKHVRLSQENAERYQVKIGNKFTPLVKGHVQLMNLFNCRLPSGYDWGVNDEFSLMRVTGTTDTFNKTWRDEKKVYIMCAKQNMVTAWEDLGKRMSWIVGGRKGEEYFVFNDCLANLQEDARSVNCKMGWNNRRAVWIL